MTPAHPLSPPPGPRAPDPGDAGSSDAEVPLDGDGRPVPDLRRTSLRAAAEAAAGPSLLWVGAGVVVAVLVAVLVGTAAGAQVLAGVAAAGGAARALLPAAREPVAVSVRSRRFDAGVLLVAAVALLVLARSLPTVPGQPG
ncbi:DUF3017 domain-containing protein [Cellulomonas marina]|uniref:DUF3017 domain-containing protein n=1 Tax=Cellulomonas marina TaxID=988821 RepID=A0A1I1A169_9CELL|nr:DUF3017 domain-containing protein [Cellulomonas marina]GIG30307.1 hypothetical protein Cma02nite_29070 [Cellulomonas marina]SFB31587.1 hypothetical protein SAMN05421867_11431 [Cellulomonas marina]